MLGAAAMSVRSGLSVGMKSPTVLFEGLRYSLATRWTSWTVTFFT